MQTNPLELVIPGTVYELSIFLFEIPTGVIADVYSRRLSVIIGYVLMGLGFIIAGLYPALIVATVGLGIIGIGSTFVSGALSAWLVDEIGQEQASQAFVRASQINVLARLAGIIVSVLIASIHLQLAVIAAGLPLLFAAGLMMLVMPETGFQPVPTSERNSWRDLFITFGKGVSFVRASRVLLAIFVVVLCFAGFGETFGKFWQAHILENFTIPGLANGDDIIWFGIISGVSIPLSLLTTEHMRKRVDLTHVGTVVRMLRGLFMGLVGCMMLFALSDVFWLALIGLWAAQICMTMIGPLMQIWINHHLASETRATVLSIIGQVNAFGEIVIGGPMVGFIAIRTSVRVTLVAVTLILLPLASVFRLVDRVQHQSVTQAHNP